MNLIIKDKNYKSLSPCIISWAKYALAMKKIKPQNSKKCSLEYWIKVLDFLIKKYPTFYNSRESAIAKFDFVKR
jgi:hypothetical protein